MKYEFIEAIPSEGIEPPGWWAVVRGHGGVEEIIDDCFDTKAQADRAGREFGPAIERANAEQQREVAMETGILHGIGAYNDAMGYCEER